ncbi:hypothetical protein T05_1110 [Trichinella murrelli]|uniref:Uncharacterized protein n=1 Tax=Trichinella murrelli TaxID=144512 RepID=A0A0V0TIW2_9BILA|nr:hypothetical protein T05_1110 [Trichinella murrelli]
MRGQLQLLGSHVFIARYKRIPHSRCHHRCEPPAEAFRAIFKPPTHRAEAAANRHRHVAFTAIFTPARPLSHQSVSTSTWFTWVFRACRSITRLGSWFVQSNVLMRFTNARRMHALLGRLKIIRLLLRDTHHYALFRTRHLKYCPACLHKLGRT